MVARLRSVPPPGQVRRAVGYVRVSMAREEMVSPELQRAAIETYCDQRGYRLTNIIEELDVSGRDFARKGVQDAIERIEANAADVIVVWKVSRFGRTRKDWYVHADRVEVAGGSLESATEAFDPLTSTGRLTRGMLVELAAWESDVKAEQWREAHAHRFKQGLTHAGGRRFGYIYDREAKIHRPDPETGPILAECYRRYIAGESPYQIARWLNTIPARTSTGARWSESTLRQVLHKGFGAGFIYRAHRPPRGQPRLRPPEWVPGAHEPVIDAKTWKAYQRRRTEVAKTPVRARSSPHPLTGLVVCAREGCGKTMNTWQGWAKTGKDSRKFYKAYKCNRGCGRNYVSQPVLFEAVKAWLAAEVAADVEARAETKARQQAKRAVAKADRATLTREIQGIDRSLARAFEGWSRGNVPDKTYEDVRASLEVERAALEARLSELDREVDATRTNVRPVARSLLRDFETLIEANPTGMREVLASLIREIRVEPGRHGKVTVTPRWA